MKTLLKNFWNNLDNDQKLILKSVAGITSIVLVLNFLVHPGLSLIAIPLQIVAIRLLSNKIVKKTKKYIFDKKSNKKFSTTIPARFRFWYFGSTLLAVIITLGAESAITILLAMLSPFVAIWLTVFALKLPISVLSPRTWQITKGASFSKPYEPHGFDSSHIDASALLHLLKIREIKLI